MTVSIREATTVDAKAILEAYEWLFDPPGARPEAWDEERAMEAVAETIESPTSTCFVAISSADARLVGICSAYLDLRSVRYGHRCWVEDLAVDPAMRSRGIGADLLAESRVWAAERGATHLELDTGERRLDAQRFYERLDPAAVSRCYSWPI